MSAEAMHETEIRMPWGMREMRDLAVRVTRLGDRRVQVVWRGSLVNLAPGEEREFALGADEVATLRIEARPDDEPLPFGFYGAYVRFEFGGREEDGSYRWWKA